MTDRCREDRSAALRRLIEDAKASGISECSVEEIFAEARALADERRRRRNAAGGGPTGCNRAAAGRVNHHRLKAVASGYGSKPDRSALRWTGGSHTRAQ